MLEIILNILLILLVMGVLIFIHELGHFIAAKLSKVRVDRFSIGMGPTVLKKKIGETEYILAALPIGGYVKILGDGDDPDQDLKEVTNDPRSFQNIHVVKKVFILIAGVTFNLLTAVIIYYGFLIASDYKFYLPAGLDSYQPVYGEKGIEKIGDLKYSELTKDGNAVEAGWPEVGYITGVGEVGGDLEEVELSNEFSQFVRSHQGGEVSVEVCEEINKDESSCAVYTTQVSKEGIIGILLSRNYLDVVEYSGSQRYFVGFLHSINMIDIGSQHIRGIFSEAVDTGDYGDAVNTVSSPIGLYFIVDFIRELGIVGFLDLVANLSLTLFLFNLLPIPALDGGRIVLVVLEKTMGRFFSKKVEGWLIKFSFIFLILFMLAIVVKDIVYFDQLRDLFS